MNLTPPVFSQKRWKVGCSYILLKSLCFHVVCCPFHTKRWIVKTASFGKPQRKKQVAKSTLSLVRNGQTCYLSYLSSFFRHAPSGRRLRYQGGAGATWPQGCENDADLYPYTQPRRQGRQEPHGRTLKEKCGGLMQKPDITPLQALWTT